jgi:uncharacterized protein YneF (UPF0154 family)
VPKKQILLRIVEVLIGLILAWFIGNWIKAQSWFQMTDKTNALGQTNPFGITLLWIYLGLLFFMVVGGYLLARRIESDGIT